MIFLVRTLKRPENNFILLRKFQVFNIASIVCSAYPRTLEGNKRWTLLVCDINFYKVEKENAFPRFGYCFISIDGY